MSEELTQRKKEVGKLSDLSLDELATLGHTITKQTKTIKKTNLTT